MAASARADIAFDAYLELGPERSLVQLRSVLKGRLRRVPSLRTLEGWSAEYHWQERIRDLERQAREAAERECVEWVSEYRRRLRDEGLVLQRRGLEWLRDKAGDTVRAHEAIRAIETGFRLEALALGEATEHIVLEEYRDERIERLTDEELRRLIEGGGPGPTAGTP
ncbi:MAG: hypothetical protein KC495_02370 [Dehalococcoidia bacterium]|nr:hypothetical protein [Dehalococcoidia bacterium]